jgi:hypothetical protein
MIAGHSLAPYEEGRRRFLPASAGVEIPEDIQELRSQRVRGHYKGERNDIWFTVNNQLVILLEEKSITSPNLPLRMMFYVMRVYQKLLGKRLYYRSPGKIPPPVFIVFYNGKDTAPEYKELKLSDSYPEEGGLTAPGTESAAEEVGVELKVRVYNINKGYNLQLIEKCRTLFEYVEFSSKSREYHNTMQLKDAIKAEVKFCMSNNILKTAFESQGQAFVDALLSEWTFEEAGEDCVDARR